jgi:hypothetical protein
MRQKASNCTGFRIILTTTGLGSYATYIFFARTRIFHPNILIGQKITRKSRRVGFVQKSKMHQTWNQSILIGRTTCRRNWCVEAGTKLLARYIPQPCISWESWGRTRRVGLGFIFNTRQKPFSSTILALMYLAISLSYRTIPTARRKK